MSNVTLDTLADPFCHTCGYNLRGLTSDRCPECGQVFDPTRPAEARIPWLRRRAIGNWSAYWQTVRLVMFEPLRFGSELWDAQCVDAMAAKQFRWIIIVQALACCMVSVAALLWQETRGGKVGVGGVVIIEAAVAVAGAIFLTFSTDLAALNVSALDPSKLWQTALGHYTCAPLAAVPFVVPIILVCYHVGETADVFAIALLLCVVAWWWIDNVLVMYSVRRSIASSVFYALAVPVAWGFIAFFALVTAMGLAGAILEFLGR